MTTQKKEIIEKHQVHGKDTGSAPVQVAIMTDRISQLTDHLKTHKKDKHSRRGLLGLVGKRRKLLQYIQGKDADAYKSLIEKLGLRR